MTIALLIAALTFLTAVVTTYKPGVTVVERIQAEERAESRAQEETR